MTGSLVPSPAGNRAVPGLPVDHMRTFEIIRPLETHWREATCEEVDCPFYLQGWTSTIPTDSVQAEYLRHNSGRAFTELRIEGGTSAFSFEAGQPCFKAHEHRLPIERPEVMIMRDGDWRANPTGKAYRMNADDWNGELGSHIERLQEDQRKHL